MDTLGTTLLSVAISTIVSTIVGMIIKHAISKSFERKEEADARRAREQVELLEYREEKRKQEQQIKLESAVQAALAPIEEKIDRIEVQLQLDREATTVTMRGTMKSMRDRYKKQGYADHGDKATWNELYNRYAEMGGNHFREYVDQWKDEVNALPSEPQ